MGGRGPSLKRGQSTVELALSSAVLLLLLLGLLDLARAFYFGVRLQDAARAGARVGVAYDWTTGTYPHLNDANIKAAVDDVLTSTGMQQSQLSNGGGATCPATADGNTTFSPPYKGTDYPSSTGVPQLYICYEDLQGVEPPLASPSGQNLNVVVLYRYGFLTGFLQNTLGPGVQISGNYQGRIP